MARPERREVTFEIDGREVRAPEGTMLVDAARMGDVEIPYFCYEPKLGQPVGACRMCLVQIEGMPKLQTACSTPVKEGMVVTTVSPEVKQAQNAVVEFLLANHPLDCPVCDKGGECPLQDISYGWGPGSSRFTEPKRHFKKPIELSPLIAIDRERCILCYRCVRFSQEVSEDHQLVFLERGDRTFVGTADGSHYIAPFSGNVIELCPVGALTSIPYRFRARPWDVEEDGTVCTLCPSQCNVRLTIRDDRRVLRVLARDNPAVDDGWLCDRGRFGYQAFHSRERIVRPLVREGTELVETSWPRALEAAAEILGRAGAKAAALVGGSATNEEGYLVQRLLREALGSPHVDSRPAPAPDPELLRACARPELAATVADIDHADAVLVIGCEPVDEMPILDLRIRKAVRRHGSKLLLMTPAPSRLDPLARVALRYLPGATSAALGALLAALGEEKASAVGLADLCAQAGLVRGVRPGPPLDVRFDGAAARPLDPERPERAAEHPEELLEELAAQLRAASDVVVIVGERALVAGGEESQARRALLALLGRLSVDGQRGARLLEVPFGANGRGLREVGCLPGLAPGLQNAGARGHAWVDLPAALAAGEVSALLLYDSDPLRGGGDRIAWERALRARAAGVVAFARFRDEVVERYAQVVLPAEVYAEKDGTVVHPDGRLQRVRQAIARAGEVRSGLRVLCELARKLGADFGEGLLSSEVTAQVAAAVPFYAGANAARIGGKGIRWQELAGAAAPTAAAPPADEPPALASAGRADGAAGAPAGVIRVAAQPALWACEETRHAPALRFLRPRQRLAIAPADAQQRGLAQGDLVRLRAGDQQLVCELAVRSAVPAGRAFLIEGLGSDGAEALLGGAALRECSIERLERAATVVASGNGRVDASSQPRR